MMPPRTVRGTVPTHRMYERSSLWHGRHAARREGDEMACPCGKRWPVGEAHP